MPIAVSGSSLIPCDFCDFPCRKEKTDKGAWIEERLDL